MEVSLALIITAFAALGTIKASSQAQRLEFAATQGDGLRIARDAGETYAEENYTALQSGAAVTKNGYTINPGTAIGQTYNPAIADLIGLGYLAAGFSVQGSFSNGQDPGTYRFSLQRTPVGCELVASGASCDIKGFTYLDQPIRAAGSTEPDGPAISAMAAKLGGNAGFTLLPNATQIIGPNGVWPEPNPVSGSPSGVIAARFGFGSSGLGQFVRLNDSRDPNLQGNLSVAGTAAVGGDLTGRGNIGTSDNVSACLRAALQTDGQVVARATNCLVRAYMDPNTARMGVNDAAGNPVVVLDGNTGNVNAGGVVNAANVAATGAVTGANVTATGAVAASTANISGNINTSSGTTLNNAGRQHIQAAENLYLQPWGGGTTIIGGGGGNGNLIAAGQVQAGALQSNGTLSVAGNATVGSQTVIGAQNIGGNQTIVGSTTVTSALTPGQIANNGWGCSSPGSIARDGSNNLFICN